MLQLAFQIAVSRITFIGDWKGSWMVPFRWPSTALFQLESCMLGSFNFCCFLLSFAITSFTVHSFEMLTGDCLYAKTEPFVAEHVSWYQRTATAWRHAVLPRRMFKFCARFYCLWRFFLVNLINIFLLSNGALYMHGVYDNLSSNYLSGSRSNFASFQSWLKWP